VKSRKRPNNLVKSIKKQKIRWDDVVPTVPALELKRLKRKQKPLFPGPLKGRNKVAKKSVSNKGKRKT
jgi:hypothetical protein